MKKVGADREVAEYPGPGHDYGTETYDDPGPCELFLSHAEQGR